MAVFSSKVENLKTSLIKTAELASLYGGEDEKNLKNYMHLIEQITSLENNDQITQKALESSKQSNNIKDFDKIYDKEMAKKKPNSKNCKCYKDMVAQVKQILQHEDCDIGNTSRQYDDDLTMEATISDIDPITKRRMEHPVKNKICKHYYEDSSIREAIKVNPRLRCPVAGCGNREYMKLSDLVEDPVFKHRLQRWRNAEQ